MDYDELSETLNKENIEKMKLEKLLDKTEKEIENITKINENLELEVERKKIEKKTFV